MNLKNHKSMFAKFLGTLCFAAGAYAADWLLPMKPGPSSGTSTRRGPHLHHSCQSAWDRVEQDQDQFIEMIGTISAVSFYNHDFNIERLDRTARGEAGLSCSGSSTRRSGKMCREDNQSLLGGRG